MAVMLSGCGFEINDQVQFWPHLVPVLRHSSNSLLLIGGGGARLTLSTSDCHRAGKRYNTIGKKNWREQGWEKWKEHQNKDTKKIVEPLIHCAELALKWFAIKSCKSDEDCFTCKSLKQLPIPHYCKVDHCVKTQLSWIFTFSSS